MEEILIQNAQTFASQHQLQLAERLGFGIHGIIFVAEDKSKAGKTALKVHRCVEPYPQKWRRDCEHLVCGRTDRHARFWCLYRLQACCKWVDAVGCPGVCEARSARERCGFRHDPDANG